MQAHQRIKRGWMNLRISAIDRETADTKTFYFEDAEDGGRSFDFWAGQYLTFRFDGLVEKPVVRSYTMSGSPCQKDIIAVTVKQIPGGLVSNWFCETAKVGDILRARGPIGKFCFDPEKDQQDLVMLAAGSGVTPFTSILREYANRLGEPGCPSSMHLLVAFRTNQDLINWDVLGKVCNIPGIRINVALTRGTDERPGFFHGRPNDEMLSHFFEGYYPKATFMSCGPDEFMKQIENHLRERGVAPERIKSESFSS